MSPLQEIEIHPGKSRGIRVIIKRDDLLFPEIQGNKWRKLKPLVEKIRGGKFNISGILTFGGAFSNHLFAVANAGQVFDFQTVGIVRGTAADFENPTLSHCQKQGMQLFRVSKKDYDWGLESEAVGEIVEKFPGFEILPEGGAGASAVQNCAGISSEILSQLPENQDFEKLFIAVPAGTGTTVAGIVAGLRGQGRVLVFPAAVYGISKEKISKMLADAGFENWQNFDLHFSSHFKKFAPPEKKLLDYLFDFQRDTGVLLDPIYTSRMFHSLWQMLAEEQAFPDNSTIVAIHTGGSQGLASSKNAQLVTKNS